MKIIFAHDHKLRFDNNTYFTLGGLSDIVTKRYTDIFGKLNIICRAIPIQSYDKKFFEIKNPNVSINAIHSSSLFFSENDKQKIKSLVNDSDGVIVRLPSFIGELVYKYAKELKKPVLSEIVTCPWDSLWNHSLKGKIIAPYMWYRTKKSALNSDYVIYVTQHFLQNRYPTKGINTGCSDVELKTHDSSVVNKRLQKIEQSTQPLILGTLAALDTKFKGQQYVIQAIAQLHKRGINFKYRLAGGGSSKYLSSIAKKYKVEHLVEFCGVIPHDKVFEWIDSIDLYIQPSLQEGLPRALVEAMSRACPAIGTNAGGIPELLPQRCILKKKSIKDIIRKLSNIDKNQLKCSAKENYEMSLNYQKDILDIKREEFYIRFKNYIQAKGIK